MATQPMLEFDPLPGRVSERIRDARKSGRLSECEADVLYMLVNLGSGPRVGLENALPISAMRLVWQRRQCKVWTDRAVKDAVKTLLEEFAIPIGSSRRSNCPGYFIVIDDAEAESTARVYLAEIKSLARRCRALSPKSPYVREMLGQVALDLNCSAPAETQPPSEEHEQPDSY